MASMWIVWTLVGVIVAVAAYDLLQTKHAILRNFPVIGHLRYLLEAVGPELRQYIVTDNDEERPFSRDQRTWVYASAKKQNNYFGFGTDNDIEGLPHYLVLKQRAFPVDGAAPGTPDHDPDHHLPCAKVVGGWRGRKHAYRPQSIINVSAMSYGSLGAAAVQAINRGCKLAGCLQNTGEGGVSPHHLHGGELIWQIGTGYYGCRTSDGGFSLERLLEVVADAPIRALEIKLSQGAKPGLGGVLPASKITAEISRIRGVPRGRDCISPARHRVFSDVDSMLDFVERLAAETGLPVGIKSAVGETAFWIELARLMERGDRGVDFITVDGGEGGTGAAPLAFADHVSLPFKLGMSRVYRIFAERDLQQRVVFIGSGKLGFPETAALAFALGCDLVGLAREPMLAIGCIQAQRCHTGHCPTGVATHSSWLMRGLDPADKAARLANYIVTLRKEVERLGHAAGVVHPALLNIDDFELLDGRFGARSAREVFDYDEGWRALSPDDRAAIDALMAGPVAARRVAFA